MKESISERDIFAIIAIINPGAYLVLMRDYKPLKECLSESEEMQANPLGKGIRGQNIIKESKAF